MKYDMRSAPADVRYRLLASTIVPRPIAWVTTRSTNGDVNLAPFSYFNLMGHNPPVVVLGFVAPPGGDGRFKDTPENILAIGEFVVHLVQEAQAESMNLTAMDAPPRIDESRLAALDLVESEIVAPPRLSGSPVAFECRCQTSLLTGREQLLIVGEVLFAHLDDSFVLDKDKGYVDTQALRLIARMHGGGYYARSGDIFEIDRISYSDHIRKARPRGG